MNRYGQSITWGTLSAPQLFTGMTRQYSVRDGLTKELFTDMSGENMAMSLNCAKSDINFEAVVTAGSVNFLDLSVVAAIAIAGFETGTVLASRVAETWRLKQPKTASIQATYYPDITSTAPAAGSLSAFTPDQSALAIVYPGQQLIYGTFGLTHTSGVVHGLTIEQILKLVDDDPSPDGKLLGVTSCGYERNLTLDLLATGTKPATGTVLTLTGAPSHGNDYRITDSEEIFEDQRGKMFRVSGAWIPPFTAS